MKWKCSGLRLSHGQTHRTGHQYLSSRVSALVLSSMYTNTHMHILSYVLTQTLSYGLSLSDRCTRVSVRTQFIYTLSSAYLSLVLVHAFSHRRRRVRFSVFGCVPLKFFTFLFFVSLSVFHQSSFFFGKGQKEKKNNAINKRPLTERSPLHDP